jgi:hypothetical protein
MAIDRIDWHASAENFPEDMPEENGGNHIGYFMEFLYKRDFLPDNPDSAVEEYMKVKNDEVTGLRFLIDNCDGKFWDVDTNEEGLKFTNYIYDYYLGEIVNILGDIPYERNYSAEDYQTVEKWLEKQLSAWVENGKPLTKKS